MQERRESERLIALIVGAAFAFNYPLLYLFSTNGAVLGIPLLFVYLFFSWLIFIVLTALLMERSPADPDTGGRSNQEQTPADE